MCLPRGVGQSSLGQISFGKAHSGSYAAKGSRPKFTRPNLTRQSSLGRSSFGQTTRIRPKSLGRSIQAIGQRSLGLSIQGVGQAHSAISVGLGQIDPEKDHSDSATPLGLGHSRMTRLSFGLGHSRMTRPSLVLGHSRMTRPTSLVLGHVYSAKVTSSSFGPGGFGGPFSVGQADSAKVTRPNRSKDKFIRPHHSDSARMIRPSSRTRPG